MRRDSATAGRMGKVLLCAATAGVLAMAWVLLPAPATSAEAPGAATPYVKKATWAETVAASRAAFCQSLAGQPKVKGTFVPFDSGVLPGTGPGVQVSLNVEDVEDLRLIGLCLRGTGNCHIWGDPRLIDKDGKETSLTSLKPKSIRVGWGQLLLNKNWQDRPLRVGDKQFQRGLWVHADSELVYGLDRKYVRFECWVGEDKDRATGQVRFQVTSGTAEPPPAFWLSCRRDFPELSAWLEHDCSDIVTYLRPRTDSSLEQELAARTIGQAPAELTAGLKAQAEALAKAGAGAGDARWLDLYAQACRLREAGQMVGGVTLPQIKDALAKDLAALVAAKPGAEDARWAEFLQHAVQRRELSTQWDALVHDIKNTSHFEKYAKEAYRVEATILPGDRDPLDIVVRRTTALLDDLMGTSAADKLAARAKQLDQLREAAKTVAVTDAAARFDLFLRACSLRRQIVLSNPLLDFDRILFIKRHRAIYNHMCDQYYGMAQHPGGGMYVLEDAFGPAPRVRDVLADSVVQNGRLKGQRLSGGPTRRWNIRFDGEGNLHGEETEGGSFLSPDLHYDGKRIAFAYVECQGDRLHRLHVDPTQGHWHEGRCYHVFSVNLDGSDLRMLTDGTFNDFDPCWLPNGRIAFMSERRGGYLRCGRTCPTYTLYDMAADGNEVNCLSFHETNEWNPSVTNDGRILYTRWDYVDRFGCTAHHPWITTLDGADSRAVHGNFAPRNSRPDMELDCRAIPGENRFIATAAPHHSQCFGSLVMIDPDVPDDDAMGPIRRITPEVGFPESQGGTETYGQAYPLSRDYYLCAYDANNELRRGGGNYGIYLVDSWGNKELLYRDPQIACMSPIPVRPTTPPPTGVVAGAALTRSAPGPRDKPTVVNDVGSGTMAVMNVYDTHRQWPEGTKITALRILQVLPMTVPSGGKRPHETGKRIALAGDSVVPARWVIGTVPVEADGSAYFTVPANREMFFQALDEKGLAVQSMRSATYIHDGERLVCGGCHEPRYRTPPAMTQLPLALRRAPSKPTSDVDGTYPFSYPRLVQPVLDKNCVPCHTKEKKAPNLGREPIANKWYASYNTLVKYGFTDYGENLRTTPGKFGAYGSKLHAMLAKGHHDLKLAPEDMHRLSLWLDLCSMFYGVYEKEGGEAQLRGEVVKATLE